MYKNNARFPDFLQKSQTLVQALLSEGSINLIALHSSFVKIAHTPKRFACPIDQRANRLCDLQKGKFEVSRTSIEANIKTWFSLNMFKSTIKKEKFQLELCG